MGNPNRATQKFVFIFFSLFYIVYWKLLVTEIESQNNR
jgi:hypothetical protein